MLSWLLDEPDAVGVRAALGAAEIVLASALTLVECDRALLRAVAVGLVPEAVAAERREVLARTAGHWIVFEVDAAVVERARQPFPSEPIRTLDALHLSTGILVRTLVPDMAFLSRDRRVRACARAMGFELLPDEAPGAGSAGDA